MRNGSAAGPIPATDSQSPSADMECEGLPRGVGLPARLPEHPGRAEPDLARRVAEPRDEGRPRRRSHPGEREHGPVPDPVLPGAEGAEELGQRPFAVPCQEGRHVRGRLVALAEGRDEPRHIQPGDGREHLGRMAPELAGFPL